MFEKMIKQEKAWNRFIVWIIKKYYLVYIIDGCMFKKHINGLKINDDLILFAMPFFFRKNDINPDFHYDWNSEIYKPFCETKLDYYTMYQVGSDIEALKLSCEKAFEILNENMENK